MFYLKVALFLIWCSVVWQQVLPVLLIFCQIKEKFDRNLKNFMLFGWQKPAIRLEQQAKRQGLLTAYLHQLPESRKCCVKYCKTISLDNGTKKYYFLRSIEHFNCSKLATKYKEYSYSSISYFSLKKCRTKRGIFFLN